MGLDLGQRRCINCENYDFKDKDFKRSLVRTDGTRGSFQIPTKCRNCGASMVLVVYENIPHNELPTYNTSSTAIAFACTVNDEPCYDEDCIKCSGNGKGWWE